MFKIGDRVVYVGDVFRDETATIAAIDHGSICVYGLAFDKSHFQCHNLGGLCDLGHGWWTDEEFIRKIEDEYADAASYDGLPSLSGLL